MSRNAKLLALPIKYAWVIAILLVLAFIGSRAIPGVSAQVALDCSGEVIRDQCVQQDVCWNLEGPQATVPPGYHIDEMQDNACVEDTTVPPPITTGEVLGASTD